MKYQREISLKNGSTCVIRNGAEQDAEAVLANFIETHRQSDFLMTYPEEITLTLEQEREYLRKKADSEREIELVAEVDGTIVGTAGIDQMGRAEKLRHRASFGISIDRAWWGVGLGRALVQACVECARKAGYIQVELDVVAANERALALYRKAGFVEYGRNPLGFRSRACGLQEIVLMRLEL